MGAGAALGVVVGVLGPVVLALLPWFAGRVGAPGEITNAVIGVSILAILGLPVVLLLAGCLLMIPDRLRGWGVAALMASGIWLISSAGVCVVALVNA